MLSRAACSTSRRLVPALGALGSRQKHSLPDLPYDYGALEPHINAQIMQLHHSKHHAAYVSNLNVAEEKYREALEKEACRGLQQSTAHQLPSRLQANI